MWHDHSINGLELAVAFLLLANGITLSATIGAVRLLVYFGRQTPGPMLVERKLEPDF